MATIINKTSKGTTSVSGKMTSSYTLIAYWYGHKFAITKSAARSFVDLKIQTSIETKDVTNSRQTYIKRKGTKTAEITFTAILDVKLGIKNVKSEARTFLAQAHIGRYGYFYCGGKKLLSCKMMITQAEVQKIEMTASGTWTYCEVSITLKQCGLYATKKKATKKKKKTTKKTKNNNNNNNKNKGKTGSSGTYTATDTKDKDKDKNKDTTKDDDKKTDAQKTIDRIKQAVDKAKKRSKDQNNNNTGTTTSGNTGTTTDRKKYPKKNRGTGIVIAGK